MPLLGLGHFGLPSPPKSRSSFEQQPYPAAFLFKSNIAIKDLVAYITDLSPMARWKDLGSAGEHAKWQVGRNT